MLIESFSYTVPLGRCTCPWENSVTVHFCCFINTPTRPGLSMSPCDMGNTHTLYLLIFIFNPLLFVIGFLLSLFWVLALMKPELIGALDCHIILIFHLWFPGLSFIFCLYLLLWEFPVQTMPVSLNYLAFSHFFFIAHWGSFAAADSGLHFQSFLLSWTVFTSSRVSYHGTTS